MIQAAHAAWRPLSVGVRILALVFLGFAGALPARRSEAAPSMPVSSTAWTRDYHAVWRYLVRSAADGTMLDALMVTMRRLLIGFIAGVVAGIPLGLFIARFQWACDTIGVLTLGLQTLPSVPWVPLALLWFGKRKPRCSSW